MLPVVRPERWRAVAVGNVLYLIGSINCDDTALIEPKVTGSQHRLTFVHNATAGSCLASTAVRWSETS